jgi:3-isopropylmalate/(R)-2-methylmalate dehydratase small subunit
MAIQLEGRARVLGDDINTDYIISSTRKRDTLDESVLKRYLLEAVDPAFAASVSEGDLLVAGRNFGCGSAMEVAATVILAAGIKAVLAQSFSRTFFRNAINNGLIPVQCDTSHTSEGDRLSVRLDGGRIGVTNHSSGRSVSGAPLPGIMLEILESGGLVAYIRGRGKWPDQELDALAI